MRKRQKNGRERVVGSTHVLNEELRAWLRRVAYETGRTRSFHVRMALYQYFGMKPNDGKK